MDLGYPTFGRATLAVALGFPIVLSALLMRSPVGAVVFWFALLLFLLPGWFLIGKWFRGVDRALVGAPLGYFLSSMVATLSVRGSLNPIVTGLAFGGLLFLTYRVGKKGTSPAAFDSEKAHTDDRLGLAASVLFGSIVCAIPFLKVGLPVEGGIAYRAYFSADLMTHLSVVSEIQRGVFPLMDPFYAGEPLGYYWLFFVFPAWLGFAAPNQGLLLSLYLAGGLLFTGLAYRLGRQVFCSPRCAFVGVVAGVGLVSYEGAFALVHSVTRKATLTEFSNINIDALARWVFELTSVDGLHRSLLYTPQHLFSYSCLLALLIFVSGETISSRRLSGAVVIGLLLGAMAGTSIVTAMIVGPWFVVSEGVRAIRARAQLMRWFSRSVVVGIVSISCLAWFAWLGFFGGASSSLTLRNPRFWELPGWLVLDFGAAIVLVVWLFAFGRRGEANSEPVGLSATELLGLFTFAIPFALFLDLRGYEGIWMVWRAGSVMLVALMALVMMALRSGIPRLMYLVFVPAGLTLLMDVYNAQDVSNRDLSAGGFPWTLVVGSDERDALDWIRDQTPKDSVVQWDARARGPAEWALIPAVAERRMAVGFPIFLLDVAKYRARERRATRRIFTSGNEQQAHALAVSAGIDFLVVGRREIEVRGGLLDALWKAPERFHTVFSQGEVTVFQVVKNQRE